MKQFFENYGAVALGILALLVLIAMITPVGNIIKTSLQSTVQTTAAGIESQTDTMTKSINAAFTNAVDFTGAKDGKYYSHGQIVADTSLPDGTNRGTEGWRLTDRQYQALIESIDIVLNEDFSVAFNNNQNTNWAWHRTLYVFNINNQNDYYVAGLNESLKHNYGAPIQFYSKEQVIPLKSNKEVELNGYSGFYTSPPTLNDTATIPVTSMCETLNLGCEVGA